MSDSQMILNDWPFLIQETMESGRVFYDVFLVNDPNPINPVSLADLDEAKAFCKVWWAKEHGY